MDIFFKAVSSVHGVTCFIFVSGGLEEGDVGRPEAADHGNPGGGRPGEGHCKKGGQLDAIERVFIPLCCVRLCPLYLMYALYRTQAKI